MKIDETVDKYLSEKRDSDMMVMAKEISYKTAINPDAVMKYFKVKNITDMLAANDIMVKHSKDKSWTKLSAEILNTKGVL